MKFCELSKVTSSLIGCVIFILYLGMTFLFLWGLSRKRPKNVLRSFGLFTGMLFTYAMLQCILGANDTMITTPFTIKQVEGFANLPVWLVCLICFLLIALETYLFSSAFRWDATHITSVSVKEAVDTIPAGVCAFEKCGRIVLKNATMDRVSRAMTGESLKSGRIFEESMNNYPHKDVLGDKEVYILPDDSVCIFSKETYLITGQKLTLLTAYDMTEEYNKTQILLQKRKSVQDLNARLMEYNRDIVSIITSQEILNAKVKIHDELGAGLLAMKHYLVNGGGPAQRTEIVKKLNDNLKFLKSEMVENKQDEYELILSTAKALDVEITIDGTLPEQEPSKHVIATAIHECFTNTLRHANGDRLFIKVREDDLSVMVSLTNNGDKPKEKIVEKGGLASLRNLVEAANGTMTVLSEDGFELNITLPKKCD